MADASWITTTYILILLYATVILVLVIRGAQRTKSLDDYALGSVAFHPIMVGLSLAASMTSAATFIINPGFIALYGMSGVLSMAVFLPLALYISLILLTRAFRRHGHAVKAITLAQWIGTRYGNNGFALYFAFLGLLLLTFIVLIAVGMTKVLSSALGADEIVVLGAMIIFIFGYMMFGGANSMVYTNAIQAGLMIVVALIMLGSGYDHFKEGISGFYAKLNAIDPLLTSWKNPSSPLFRDVFEIGVCAMIVGLAIVCQPHIITRSLLLREERQVKKFLTTTILVQILFFSVVFTGLYARLTFPDLTANGTPLKMDGIIPAYVVTEFPVWVGLIVIMGLLSAGLSTMENLIQSLSTTITRDILISLSGQRPFWSSYLTSVGLNRIVIGALGCGAFFLSRDQILNPTLSVGIFAQNGVYAYFSAAFIPVLAGIFLRQVHILVPVLASIAALVTHGAVYYGELTPYTTGAVRNPAVAAALAIITATITGLITHLITRNKKTVIIANQG